MAKCKALTGSAVKALTYGQMHNAYSRIKPDTVQSLLSMIFDETPQSHARKIYKSQQNVTQIT